MTRIERLELRVERRLQLWRGWLVRQRGAHVGTRFGVERGVRILYPRYLRAGDDVLIQEYSFLHCLSEEGVWFGNHSIVSHNFWLGCGGSGYFYLGEHSYIGPNGVMGASGGIRIGHHVQMGPGVTITAENHVFENAVLPIHHQGVQRQGVVIEDDCWIAGRVTILDGITVGQGSVIGAGSVVTHSIPPFSVAYGVPARVVRSRTNSVQEGITS